MSDSTQANLNCHRDSWNNHSEISIYRTNGNARVKMYWDRFLEEEGQFIPKSVLQEIYGRLNDMEENLVKQKIRIESGSISINQDSMQNLWELDGSNPRGELNGVVQFREAFQNPPKVIIAISHIDIASDANARLSTRVSDVTNDNFTYKFHTWSDTRVWRGGAQWIAYGN